MARVAELQYGKRGDQTVLELAVPKGTKLAEALKLKETLADHIARLPRGCGPCLSGEPFLIRERLEHVIRVDLDTLRVIGQ